MATDPTDDPPFSGREEDLALLARHLQGDSLPPVLYLYGAPGVGKTALLRELRQRHDHLSWLWREAPGLEDDPE